MKAGLFVFQFWILIYNTLMLSRQIHAAEYEGRGTDTLNVDLVLNLTENSSTALNNGADINFWIKDETTDYHNLLVFSAFSVLKMSVIYNDVSNVFSIKTEYNGETMTTDIYTSTTHYWVNIQLQANSSSLMDLLAWNYGSYMLGPSIDHKYTTFVPFSDTTIRFYSTTAPRGVLFSEVRSYQLQSNFSPGVFYRQYSVINNIPSSLIKYTRITNGTFFLNAQISGAASITVSPVEALSVTIWNKGYRMTVDFGIWAAWNQTGWNYCEVVDSSFNNLCRIWDISVSSWIISSLCPIDYYKENGICKRCPVGWIEWSSYSNWTYWDSGLSLITESSGSIDCIWPSGMFGIPNASTDTLVCNSCTSPCAEWNFISTNCTKWSGTNYYLDQTWVSSWGTGKYGDPADNVWKVCGPLWDVWVDSKHCTTWSGTKVVSNGTWVSSWPSNSILIGNVWNFWTTGCSKWSGSINTCTACISGYYLNGTACGLTCADGYFGDNLSNSCQSCDTTKWTKWLSLDTWTECISTLYLINYKWQSSWISGYYNQTISTGVNVCKSCPVSWAEWTDMNKCTYWQNGLYRWASDVNTVTCVVNWPAGYYETLDVDGVTKICSACMTNWLNWTSTTTCNYWVIGQVSQFNGVQDVWQNQWNPSYYLDDIGKCQQWPTSWSAWTSLSYWTSWATGYSLNGTFWVADSLWIGNYYLIAGYCNVCPTEWSAWTSTSTWTNCINGYHLSGSTWIPNWGNGVRDELETWDDGNILSGDGWSSTCIVEPNYIWIYSTSISADIWYWDPKFISARWMNNWSIIELAFGNQIKINETALGSSPSQNLNTFWNQIINSPNGGSLGLSTGWKIIKNEKNQYIIRIDFSSDATFGNSDPSVITLNPYFEVMTGCSGNIPIIYPVLPLPIDDPEIIFNANSFDVSFWANSFILDILNSKGLTNRNLSSVTWSILSIDSITTSVEKDSLNSYLSSNFANLKYIKFDYSTISSLAGKTLEISVSLTNFLSQTSSKSVLVNFLSTKEIILDGLFSSYSLSENVDQIFHLSTRIPICSGENAQTIKSQEQSISVSCELYQSDGITLVQVLTNCTIPKYTMSYPNSYQLKVTASSSSLLSGNL